jgi:PleD family two-component response regulator
MGLASLELDQDGSGLISKADAALYRAKHAGRDQVSL